MRAAALALAAVLAAACTQPAPVGEKASPRGAAPGPIAPAGVAPEAVPPELKPLVERADAAIAELQGTLGKRLAGRLAEAGAPGAVEVCAGEAQGLTAAVGERHGLALGRTSAKLRNERNAPRPWVLAWLSRHVGGKAAEAKPEVVDLGDRIGVVRPIAVAAPCLVCHGPAATLDPRAAALLAERYPADAATGFAEGDLRGAFWAEVPKVAALGADDEGGPADD